MIKIQIIEKLNFKQSLIIVERILTFFIKVLIPVILLGILIMSFIYLFTLISFQPYAVFKDIEKNPNFYVVISFGISFLTVLTILSFVFLIKTIKSSKV